MCSLLACSFLFLLLLSGIALFVLKDAISAHFKKKKTDVSIKFNDPAYMIRSTTADAGLQDGSLTAYLILCPFVSSTIL
jgi:hypothetical protein